VHSLHAADIFRALRGAKRGCPHRPQGAKRVCPGQKCAPRLTFSPRTRTTPHLTSVGYTDRLEFRNLRSRAYFDKQISVPTYATNHSDPFAASAPPVEPTLLLTRPSRSPIFLINTIIAWTRILPEVREFITRHTAYWCTYPSPGSSFLAREKAFLCAFFCQSGTVRIPCLRSLCTYKFLKSVPTFGPPVGCLPPHF